METVARIGGGPPGLMVATTRTWNNNLLNGFHGGAGIRSRPDSNAESTP
jgi:hypothetical protein